MPKPEQNFHYQDLETGEAKWYGPDYPENGDPPEGAVRNQAVFKAPEPEDLTPREVLEANADPTRAGSESDGVELRGVAGADETGDQSRSSTAPSTAPPRRSGRV